LADYVLSKFSKDEAPLMESGKDRAVLAVELILKDGVTKAMNETNSAPKA